MSFDIFDNFATDEALEVTGVWHELKPGSRIRVARIDNPLYTAEYQKQVDENLEGLTVANSEKATEAEKEAGQKLGRDILARVMARHILVGWEGLNYRGKPIDYSVENAEKLLQHKDFADLVLRLSGNVNHFRLKAEEEQEKN